MPIYYVILEQLRQSNLNFSVWTLVKSIETTLEEAQILYDREVAPLTFGTGRYFSVFYIYREPPNPFKKSEKN